MDDPVPRRPRRAATPAGDTLRLEVDRSRPGGRTLLVDGVEQSYVDLAEPGHLRFDYVRRMASVIDAAAPGGARLRMLHLGGGALTLPRYVAATRPGSAQLVIDNDEDLVELVTRELPPPAGVRIQLADARAAVVAEPDGRYDLVLGDVYRAARMPAHLTTREFAAEVARVLRPDGIYLVNLTDLPPLVFSRVQVATLNAAFAEVCLIGARGMLRARRYGNIVLAAARRPGRLPIARLTARAARDPVPGRVLAGTDLVAFEAGARPATDPG